MTNETKKGREKYDLEKFLGDETPVDPESELKEKIEYTQRKYKK